MKIARRRRSALLVVASVATAYSLISGSVAPLILLLPAWLLWLAWRFDNHTGSLLMLAMLVVLALGALTMLVALLALQR